MQSGAVRKMGAEKALPARRNVERTRSGYTLPQPIQKPILGTDRVMHAEIRIDDSVVMLADPGPGWPAVAAFVHVYVPDVDATYRRALEAGATSVQAPVKKEDEDKRGGVKDAGGTTWWIATKVE